MGVIQQSQDAYLIGKFLLSLFGRETFLGHNLHCADRLGLAVDHLAHLRRGPCAQHATQLLVLRVRAGFFADEVREVELQVLLRHSRHYVVERGANLIHCYRPGH